MPAATLAALLAAGCALGRDIPDLGRIYDEAAKVHDLRRNPVIVIPGILGSKLVDDETGTVVWGAFEGDYANPNRPAGARLFSIPMAEGVPLSELRDGVRSAGALERVRVHLIGLPIFMNAYIHILEALGVGSYRDQQLAEAGAIDYGPGHFTCFQFDYDWRRDLVEGAQQLHAFILEKKSYVVEEMEKRYGIVDADVKFDIVAHSMGGVLTRYYLRYGAADLPADGSAPEVTWAGADHVERAILVAPPNAGSAQSVMDLVEGRDFGFFLPRYDPVILGTLPAVYQLLPRSRHGAVVDTRGRPVEDVFAPELWESMGWGLADPDRDHVLRRLLPHVESASDRRRIALDHQRKCLERAARFTAAVDTPAEPPAGLQLYVFVGDAVPTPSVVGVGLDGDVRVVARGPGDGTVLRSSALMDERVGRPWEARLVTPIRWEQVFFLFTDHLGLTEDPSFTDNVLYLLLEDPRS
ncbi:MAG: hypothetical protein O7B99_08670 [Planctomycetota bacterium]|nr:hypothetical protein [Planctomycetota bacterium]